MKSISVKAYAKINIGLDVLRRRSDGYHDVCMIMQSLCLHDNLTIKITENEGISLKSNLAYLPNDRRNLVYKAAALFMEANSIKCGLEINLDKKIPVAAGLAGGSSDAAASLKGLNQLFQTGMSDADLMRLGVKIGADVPYCILLGTALSEGIGERLTPLHPLPDCHILLVKPDISVSTRQVYESLRLDAFTIHPDIEGMKKALVCADLDALTAKMANLLESVTIRMHPVIDEIKKDMIQAGAMNSLMSGSGPTVFGIFRNKSQAEEAYTYFTDNYKHAVQVFLTRPYHPLLSPCSLES